MIDAPVTDRSGKDLQSDPNLTIPRADLGRPTLFLEPQPYRRRRLIDAARLLPVFGMFLLIIPPGLLRATKDANTTSMLIYLIVVWAAMIFIAALLGRFMRATDAPSMPSSDVAPLSDTEA